MWKKFSNWLEVFEFILLNMDSINSLITLHRRWISFISKNFIRFSNVWSLKIFILHSTINTYLPSKRSNNMLNIYIKDDNTFLTIIYYCSICWKTLIYTINSMLFFNAWRIIKIRNFIKSRYVRISNEMLHVFSWKYGLIKSNDSKFNWRHYLNYLKKSRSNVNQFIIYIRIGSLAVYRF